MLTAVTGAVFPQSARAAVTCPPGTIFVNTGGATRDLYEYSVDGTLIRSTQLFRDYGDIAFSSDGLTLYGVNFSRPGTLYTIDTATGAETGSIPITGALPFVSVNALSALPNGNLLMGASGDRSVYELDTETGVSTIYQASFPAGFASGGDFLTLADGDVLAVASIDSGAPANSSALFRFSPDGTVTQIGTVPQAFGAAQSGGSIYLAGSGGGLYEVGALPATASTTPIPTTNIAATGLAFYGATSAQDSGLCSNLTVNKTATPESGTALLPGQTVTYTVVLSNTDGTAPAEVDKTDDLSGVLDDATITTAPVVTSGTPLTLGPVSDGSFRITGVIPVGGQTTLTYTVTVNDPDTGDHVMSNYVVDTGTAPPGECVAGDTSCTVHPVSELTLTKTATPSAPAQYTVGQTVDYSFVAENTGGSALSDVTVTDTGFTGSGTLGPITPASVATLAIGETATFTAAYTLTQADVDRGSTSNTATATGTPPTGDPVTSPPSTATIPVTPGPALRVAKTADTTEITEAGQTVTYSFVVTNTGTVTITDVSPVEGAFSGAGDLGPITPTTPATLTPGQSATFTSTYVVTQADVDSGALTNTATATGTTPGGDLVPTTPESSVNIPVASAPALTVEKTSDTTEITAAGQTLTYTFVVTNTGNVTATDVSPVEGDFSGTGTISPVTPTAADSLAPGDSATFTATYVVTQADVDSGALSNTATATGTTPGGDPFPTPPDSTVTVPVTSGPALAVEKTADTTEITAAGQTVTYSFVVTNNGNITVTDVSPVEADFSGTGTLSPLTPTAAASLAPGESATFTATYVVTQADVDSGNLTNTATATGTTPGGDPVPTPPGSTVEIPTTPAPSITVQKTADTTEITEAGQTVTYSFVVTNTGNVTVSDVSPVEADFSGAGDLGPITPATAASLAPGGSATFTATYVVTQADIDSGNLTNTATATGTTPGGDPVPTPPSSTIEIPTTPTPALTLVKSVSPAGATTAGESVTYSFLVTNTGNVSVDDVTVTETQFTGTGTLSAIDPTTAGPLAPGQTITFTSTYVLTQADIDAGVVSNSATASGTPVTPDSPDITTPPSTAVVITEPTPALQVVKTADVTEITEAGQTVTYSFVVSNTGNVTATDVAPVEGDFTGTGELSEFAPVSVGTLAPGESATFTATYVVTQADVDAGTLSNTATTTGTTPGGDPFPPAPPSTVDVPVTPAPGLEVVKTADVTEITEAGQTITYSFVVSNTGNITATDVAPNEGDFSGTGELSEFAPTAVEVLAPGESATFTATYVVTQADVDAGTLSNTATTTGTTPGGDPFPPAPPSTVDVPVTQAPGLEVVKTADVTEITEAGQTVTYSFVVSNTGNTTATDVAPVEGDFTGTGELGEFAPTAVGVLAPGESATFAATYVVTQADVDAGTLSNTATTTGTTPGGDPFPPAPPSTVNVPVTQAPGLEVVKTADVTEITEAGQTVTYSFVVSNTGNVTATDVAPVEGDFTGTGELSEFAPTAVDVLAPGESATFTATYVVTQADVDAGTLSNTATTTGTTPGGDPFPPSPPSTVDVPTTSAPGISVVKSANVTEDEFAVGTEVTYSFVATNTGNVSLTGVQIEEGTFSGTGALSPVAPESVALLAAGESATFSATYVLTQADVNAGQVTNEARALGTPVFSGPGTPNAPIPSAPSDAIVPVDQAPALSIVKSADLTEITEAGQTVTYSFVVTNTGNTTITDPVIDDTEFSGTGDLSPITGPDEAVILLPGQEVSYSATYVVTQADVDSGTLTNTATVTGNTPTGPTDPSTPSTVTVPVTPSPSLQIVKTADKDSVVGAGQVITYSFTITNTGNVTQNDVTVQEGTFTGTGALGPIVCANGAAALAPGQTIVCTAQYQTTLGDVQAGSVSNTAVATGMPPVTPGEPTVSVPSTTEVTVTPPAVLAFTGTDGLLGLAGIAGGLLLIGGLLVGIRRRQAATGEIAE
ncbi:hypothetical protein SOM11_14250 [Frigoribacterium sp. CFBP9039]|uniref:DUF7507 domain-containing protein n=1 Tax=Frigoribacterium sp. CFBP9029 TaxID=3096541 RepID=UPI002A6A0037|nr:hypothetical protein [Frigoribacterium sp. CFBP9039]MDY0947154.1 hypothetical protein [Frigoribacterium sp. CFBP9039]